MRHALTCITTWYLFFKKPDHVILHIGTYNVAQYEGMEIDVIENGDINNNHLNSRGLYLNGKGVLHFARSLIEGIRKL